MEDKRLHQIKQNYCIYYKRKDTIKIKAQLSVIVPAEYWTVLARYLHGMISQIDYEQEMKRMLTEDRAKWLHNEMLRAIIHNAHFSRSPPPGIIMQKKADTARTKVSVKEPDEEGKNHGFESLFAADYGHLLSLKQLYQRMKLVINDATMEIDSKSVGLIFSLVKKFVLILLKKAYDLDILENKGVFKKKMNIEGLIYILKNDPVFSQFISPSLEIKYGKFKECC